MGTTPYIWAQELPQIEKFMRDGLTSAEIGRYYGITPQHVNRLLRTLNSPMRSKRKPRHDIQLPKYMPVDKKKLKRQLMDNQRKAAENILYVEWKHAAESRGMLWALALGDIYWNNRCPVRGIPLEYRVMGYTHNNRLNKPMLSMKDPVRGFVPGNVRVISAMAAMETRLRVRELKEMEAADRARRINPA